jgi:hypothetical protein
VIENDDELLQLWDEHFELNFRDSVIFGKRVLTPKKLMEIVRGKLGEILETRSRLLESLNVFDKMDEKIAERASKCHLKYDQTTTSIIQGKGTCEVCIADAQIKTHESSFLDRVAEYSNKNTQNKKNVLFGLDNKDEASVISKTVAKNQLPLVNSKITAVKSSTVNRTRECRATPLDPVIVKKNASVAEATADDALMKSGNVSGLETLIKLFIYFGRYNETIRVRAETGKRKIKLFELMKEEMKVVSRHWQNVLNEVQAYDELKLNRARVKLVEENEKVLDMISLKPSKVEFCLNICITEELETRKKLSKKANQLLFLQNSLKVEESKFNYIFFDLSSFSILNLFFQRVN